MHKSTFWLIFAILCIYFSLVLCEEPTAVQELESKDSDILKSESTALQEEARTRRRHRHHLYSLWGFYGLAIAYLVKVKVVVVAFFVGSAVYLGLRYLWPHKCAGGEIYKEGSVILDHPPSFAQHDHIPYSLDHEHYHDNHYDSGSFTSSSGPASFEPYSAYSSHSYSESENAFPSSSFTGSDGPPESLSADTTKTFRRKRSEPKPGQEHKEDVGTIENLARQMVVQEEQIGEFMLNFLGLDSAACRRRFICEMEFKSKKNPLTSMAFRLIGRSFFAKYTNNRNPLREANSFEECAAVNPECVFIENNEETEQETADEIETTNINSASEEQLEMSDVANEAVTLQSSLEDNNIIDKQNENYLRAEFRSNSLRKRLRGGHYLKDN